MQDLRKTDVSCLVFPTFGSYLGQKMDAVDYTIIHWLKILPRFIFQRISVGAAAFQSSRVYTTF